MGWSSKTRKSCHPLPSKTKGSMGVLAITALFKKQQVSHAVQLISSRYPAVCYSATQMTISEQQKQ